MNPVSKSLLLSFLTLVSASSAVMADDGFDRARILYENKLYTEAMAAFQSLPAYGDDADIDGYATLCAQKRHVPGYETLVENYLTKYPDGRLSREVRLEKALDRFDARDYSGALSEFSLIPSEKVEEKSRAEYSFKKGYCHFKAGDNGAAGYEFSNVDHMPVNDYSAPAWFCSGYIAYCGLSFDEALKWFGKASSDNRFAPISDYYSVVCNFELKNHSRVVSDGVGLYNGNVPPDKKAHLARILSESYLILGNKEEARNYYTIAEDGLPKSRADFFYAGSLMFATGDWSAAVDNYSSMPEKTDSLGQIAWYNTALSYINLKNKVAALNAFREASSLDFDPVMSEDAMFNYAKLAFDLNGDASVFSAYMDRFSDSVRGEKIYSYIAVAALSSRDYQGAIESYDKIETLEGNDRVNYVKANYLRGAELLSAGSYRKAIQCLTAVSYYSDRGEVVSQLADFALAEARYRNSQYRESADKFIELYNASALFGKPQGEAVPYNVAYACLKCGDYEKAVHWFDVYCNDGGKRYRKDAMLRKADCIMAQGKYEEAYQAYQAVLDKYYNVEDIYPYYSCAVAYGLAASSKREAKSRTSKKIELLGNVMNASPSSAYYAEALYELGKTYEESKQTAKAITCFTKVVNDAPESAYAAKSLLEIGTVNRNAGSVEAALEAYGTVVEKMPSSTFSDDALLAIEAIYQSLNQPDKYFAYLDRIGRGSAKTDDEKRSMSFSAAQQSYYSGEYQAAMESFNAVKNGWPLSEEAYAADWYLGECYRNTGDKVLACDAYRRIIDKGRGTYYEKALLQYASVCYSLEDYTEAYSAYDSLAVASSDSATLSLARIELMRSAYMAKRYSDAEKAAAVVISGAGTSSDVVREAKMTRAGSLMAMSRREEAMECFRELSSEPLTKEGAEASYIVIQGLFDAGDFDAVKEKVYAFSDSGTAHQHWLALSFIVLGDSFAELGNFKQAKATFQSIADGYRDSEEINEELRIRIEKLNSMNL